MRYAIIGLGWAARAFHLPALKSVPEAQIVGGADPSAEQRESFGRETGIPTFASLDELLERTSPEVVAIATPPDSHLDLCLRSLEAAAHVLCEKPFVNNVGEAETVLAAAAAAGRQVAINHEYREKPIFRAVKDTIGAPGVGRLVFTQIVQLMDLAPWDESTPWRRDMPNRTLFEGGVHLVDLLLMLYGERAEAVYARRSSGLDQSRDADAIHLLTIEFPGNRLAQITIDRLCRAGTRYIELRADCEHASLRASHGGRVLFQIGLKRAERPSARLLYGLGGLAWIERGTTRKTLARSPRNPAVVATGSLFRKIDAAFRENREPPSSAREARDGLEIIDAAYRSAETGERVVIAG